MFIFGVLALPGLVVLWFVGGGVFLSLAVVLAVFLAAGVILLDCGVVGVVFLIVLAGVWALPGLGVMGVSSGGVFLSLGGVLTFLLWLTLGWKMG